MSKRAIFDFSNTCPRIDKAIGQAESALEQLMDELLEEACPLLSGSARQNIVIDWGKRALEAVSDAFETVRSTNEEMRRAAEDQIERLARELDDAEAANA